MTNPRCTGSGRSWTASSLTAPRALIPLTSCVRPRMRRLLSSGGSPRDRSGAELLLVEDGRCPSNLVSGRIGRSVTTIPASGRGSSEAAAPFWETAPERVLGERRGSADLGSVRGGAGRSAADPLGPY